MGQKVVPSQAGSGEDGTELPRVFSPHPSPEPPAAHPALIVSHDPYDFAPGGTRRSLCPWTVCWHGWAPERLSALSRATQQVAGLGPGSPSLAPRPWSMLSSCLETRNPQKNAEKMH